MHQHHAVANAAVGRRAGAGRRLAGMPPSVLGDMVVAGLEHSIRRPRPSSETGEIAGVIMEPIIINPGADAP